MSKQDFKRFKQNLEEASRKIAEISQVSIKTVRYYCKRGDHYLNEAEVTRDRLGRPLCPIHKRYVQHKKHITNLKVGTNTVSGQLALCYKKLGECPDQWMTNFSGVLRVFCMRETPCWKDEK